MRFLFAALLLAFAAVPGHAQDARPGIYVMRHLNTPAGERDPELTPEGRRAADALAAWLVEERPAAIYISDYRRTRQTVAPLAQRAGLEPKIYDPADTPGLIARVRAEPGLALIVGHSNTVPEIIAQLGGTRPAPLVHEDFGDIWFIAPDGATTRGRVDAPRP